MTSPGTPGVSSLPLLGSSFGSFRHSPSLGASASGITRELPLSSAEAKTMRAKLFTYDADFAKFIRGSKESVDKKAALQEAFQYYQTAFNTVYSAYSVLAG